ncbi:condensation domain-containing protein [Streptomyces sp. NPDC004788]
MTAHARRTPPKAPRPATVTLGYGRDDGHTGARGRGEERRGPLTMGQANMIRCMLRDEPGQINIHDVWPVPAGASTEDALDALRTLVDRHEALRTTFPHAPGAAPQEQVVAAEGTFTVTVLDHDELPPEAGRYAEVLARAARDTRFRLDRDFPLRVAVVSRAGAPRHLALAASHAATDGSALALLREEWLTLLGGEKLPDPTAITPTALTPLGLAAEETSPAGLRKSEASLAHWERILRTGPQAMFAEPDAHGAETRAPCLTLRSRRGARALAEVAARTGALPSTALLTAWCALVAHRAGQPVCVAAVPTANRFQSRLARTVAPLSQDALLSLDIQAAPSFDALLRKAWGAALKAYRHSQFDALRLWDMIGRVTRERGSHFARDIVFNDISALPATLAGAAPPDTTAPDLELTWGPAQTLPSRVLTFVHETAPVLRLATWTDPALFTREQAEDLATGLVRLLEAAADGDVPLGSLTEVTGVRPAERGADWARVDGCWVSPPAVADTLSRALGGRPAHARVDADGTLVAYVAAGTEPLTPAEAHSALMAALPGRPGVLAPRRYVIVADPPEGTETGTGTGTGTATGAGTARTDAWLTQRILTEGTGREAADAT